MMDPNNIKPVVFDPKFMIPTEVVDDVICRFLLNIPKEEKFDPIRVCFQVELAHWFFLDYYCGEGCSPRLAQLRNMPYNQFAYIMFQKTPHLKAQLPGIELHLAAFREYKMRVPTYGAILMNQNLTKAVLVQGFRNHWGFPKGKVNEVEDPVSCAIREVYEETGYDISPLVNEDHYIESRIFERNDRLYLVRGVDINYRFQPQTMFEIKNIKWFKINELPEHKKDTNPAVLKSGVPISNFYSVYPYVKRLRMWIADKLEGKNKIQNFKVRPEPGEYQAMQGNTPGQRSLNNTLTPGANMEPFQFPLQFLQSGGVSSVSAASGWQLFPLAQVQAQAAAAAVAAAAAAAEQKPFAMNSNALQELLFSQHNQSHSQQFLPANRQLQGQGQAQAQGSTKPNTNTNAKGSKNARRRLFSEEFIQGPAGAGIIGKPSNKKAGNRQSEPSKSERFVKNPHLNAPAWANFTFDRERLYKAFFTPPPPTASVS